MEKIEAVITGDIVNSTKLSLPERSTMLSALESLPEILSPIQRVNIEISRGDSFQIGMIDAVNSIKIALSIRAFLRTHKMEGAKMLLDARLAIGLGTFNYKSNSLSTSDGEAFRVSGRLLDQMHKSRLEISTPWQDMNEELKLTTAFVDDIVSSWTQSQSKIELMGYILTKKRSEIAKRLGISRQMVDKSMRLSKETLVDTYIDRYERLIIDHIETTI